VEALDDRWAVHVPEGPLITPRLLLCPGGRSYPATGTTGDGYGWLESLGLDVVTPVPALVPLTSDAHWVHALSGVSLPEAEARLVDARGRVVARRRRPVLFTHRGLSGPGAMDLSEPVARAALRGEARSLAILVDLLPDVPESALDARLVEASRAPGAPSLARIVGDRVPARLLPQVVAQAGLVEANPRLHVLPRADRLRLVAALKGLRVPLTGTLGWDEAEVTGGGLALDAVQRTTMAVRGRPGLYVFGELLDLAGPIGGLNFQAAFATGELAARDAVRALPA
jgi:predicted Rossmann fold flavoprotein